MAHPVFNRETMLDISVNIIPLFILAFFIGVLFFLSPWPPSLFMTIVALGLHVIPLVGLAILTYVAAKYI